MLGPAIDLFAFNSLENAVSPFVVSSDFVSQASFAIDWVFSREQTKGVRLEPVPKVFSLL